MQPTLCLHGSSDQTILCGFFDGHGVKDSLANIRETGDFVCSLATYDLRHQMNTTSAGVPPHINEFALGGLTAVKSELVAPPRVKESPAAFECRHWKTVELPPAFPGGPSGYHVVFGLIVGIHIDDAFIKDGMVDTGAMQPIARLGYHDYSVVTAETMFSIRRPDVDKDGKVIPPR